MDFIKMMDSETGEIFNLPPIGECSDMIPGHIAEEKSAPTMEENIERNISIVALTEKVTALEAENALLKRKENAQTEELKEYLDNIDMTKYHFSRTLIPEEKDRENEYTGLIPICIAISFLMLFCVLSTLV